MSFILPDADGTLMVVFEVIMKEGCADAYFDLAAHLRPELEKIDGFISVERFQSTTTPNKFLSLSRWRDEDAIARWRAHHEHQTAQNKGKHSLFADFRISVVRVQRSYTLTERLQAEV